MAADAKVSFQVELDSEKANQDLKTLNTTAGKNKKANATMVKGTKIAAAGLVAIGGASLIAAADLEATNAKFDTVFGGMSTDMNDYLDDWNNITSATQSEARSMASGIQDLLIPTGMARDSATELTEGYMTAIGALANFNSATEDNASVTAAMQSALTGEYTSLKKLGIQTSKEKVQLRAVEMGLAATTDEVTSEMEAQALLAEITDQSSDALSTFNEDSLDAKTKLGIAKDQMIDAAAVLGEQLLPLLTGAATALSDLATWISENSELVTILIATFALLVIGFAAYNAITTIMAVVNTAAAVAGTSLATATLALLAPYLAIIAVVLAIVAVGVALYKNWDLIKEKAGELASAIGTKFSEIKDGITNKINAAKEAVKNAIDKIKGFFKFHWSLPKLKMPHFSMQGSFSLLPPRVPHVGVDWYAKGGVMTRPTMFGMNGSIAMVGGEAGPEAIAPISTLQSYIADAVNQQGSQVIQINMTNTTNLDGEQIAQNQMPYIYDLAVSGGGNR